jgi:uncharacterized protein YfaS (alpha-2-macroglobulin family)
MRTLSATLTCTLALVACAVTHQLQRSASSPGNPAPIFADTEPAPAGTELRVFVDRDKLVGWIAGSSSFEGETARIYIAGRATSAMIDANNTFMLPYVVAGPTEAEVHVGELSQRVTLEPPIVLEPAAYVVTDRSAYRPGQTLKFTAMLRRVEHGELRPEVKSPIEIKLVSDAKQTTIAKLSVPVDARGRATGEYTFTSADALDGYTLQIPGYRGDAKITLAEYRKSKVKLEVDAKVADRSADLEFRALDFLDHAVAGKVTFKAQIVREPEAPSKLRDGFAYGGPRTTLYRDEQLLHAANPGTATRMWDAGRHAVHEITGEVTLDDKGRGTYTIPLESSHVRGHHQLVVESTIVDANGREQRTSRSIPLARRDLRVQISTPHELVATTTPVDLAIRVTDANGRLVVPVSASVAALRIAPVMPAYAYGNNNLNGFYLNNGINNLNGIQLGNGGNGQWVGGPNGGHWVNNNFAILENGQRPRCFYTGAGCNRLRALRTKVPRPALVAPDDTLAATAAVVGDTASLALTDPGAYRLIVNAKLTDGSTVWGETGVAVRDPEVMPALVLELDRAEVDHGDSLAGTLYARYRDAAVLLVVRDAAGIRSRHRAVLANGKARFDLPTEGVGYGASVEAYVLAAEQTIESAQQLVRVVPSHRALTVKTDVKETYGPGDTVDLGVEVGTREPVEVVVSVFDQSLLGIAPDRSIDPRSFFYGDDRLHARAALASLQAKLGDLTIGEIRDQARALASAKTLVRVVEETQAREDAALIEQYLAPTSTLNPHTVVQVLRFLGIAATASDVHDYSSSQSARKLRGDARLIDVLASMPKIAFVQVADTIAVFDPTREALRPVASPVFLGGGASGNASFSATGNASYSVAPSISFVPAGPAPLAGGDSTGAVRRDFADSATWQVVTTDGQGRARVKFKLPDSLTHWQVVVTAIGPRSVGRAVTKLKTVRDVMIWPLLPRQMVEGDTIELGASVHNLTGADRDIAVSLQADRTDVLTPASFSIRVPKNGTVPVTWRVRAKGAGLASLMMSAAAPGTPPDASLKRIPIVPSTAEQVVTASGFANRPLTIEIPDGVDPRDAKLELTFAPTLAADMAKSLDYLVEYPYGCAEQTMSRFAPAIEVAGVLENLGIKDGSLVARLPSVVAGGVKRLTELQQADGGWAWNGHADTHEMITPYVVWGLLRAERAGYKLPNEATLPRGLDRIRQLIEQRTGDDQLSDRTYLMYVYGQKHKLPDVWWSWLVARQNKLSDYALALALEIAVTRGDGVIADRFATALRTRAVKASGGAHWQTGSFSRWMEDPIETTAVAMSALIAHDATDPMLAEVISYFVATKRGDRWNSTKDTAMVLYAMTAYVRAHRISSSVAPSVDYTVDNGPSHRVTFPDRLSRTVTFDGKLSRKSTLAFASSSPGVMVRAVLRYRTKGRDLPASADGLVVARTLHLLDATGKRIKQLAKGDRVPRGSYVESAVTVTHGKPELMRFLLIEDPKPAGAEALPVEDRRMPRQLKQWNLREDRETHLAFHHQQVGPQTEVRSVFHLETAGDLAFVPASAELMYQTATRGHSGSFTLRVD